MKLRFLLAPGNLAALASMLLLGACDGHKKEDTLKLHQPHGHHGHGHDGEGDHGHGDDHAEDGDHGGGGEKKAH